MQALRGRSPFRRRHGRGILGVLCRAGKGNGTPKRFPPHETRLLARLQRSLLPVPLSLLVPPGGACCWRWTARCRLLPWRPRCFTRARPCAMVRRCAPVCAGVRRCLCAPRVRAKEAERAPASSARHLPKKEVVCFSALTKWASRPNEGKCVPQYPAGECKIMSRWERALFTTLPFIITSPQRFMRS